jgi:hypothetical protein
MPRRTLFPARRESRRSRGEVKAGDPCLGHPFSQGHRAVGGVPVLPVLTGKLTGGTGRKGTGTGSGREKERHGQGLPRDGRALAGRAVVPRFRRMGRVRRKAGARDAPSPWGQKKSRRGAPTPRRPSSSTHTVPVRRFRHKLTTAVHPYMKTALARGFQCFRQGRPGCVQMFLHFFRDPRGKRSCRGGKGGVWLAA